MPASVQNISPCPARFPRRFGRHLRPAAQRYAHQPTDPICRAIRASGVEGGVSSRHSDDGSGTSVRATMNSSRRSHSSGPWGPRAWAKLVGADRGPDGRRRSLGKLDALDRPGLWKPGSAVLDFVRGPRPPSPRSLGVDVSFQATSAAPPGHRQLAAAFGQGR